MGSAGCLMSKFAITVTVMASIDALPVRAIAYTCIVAAILALFVAVRQWLQNVNNFPRGFHFHLDLSLLDYWSEFARPA